MPMEDDMNATPCSCATWQSWMRDQRKYTSSLGTKLSLLERHDKTLCHLGA